MTHPRYVCIHGHFYQPPRENPWLDVIEVQDSAAPFHDWNERITRECYGPNTRSRVLDGQGRITHLVNNYAWISFNFGPTLLSWMDDHAPWAMRDIVEADRVSRSRHGGHGNALAQVYNHMILPLASERDQRTQVLWGLADFRHRFGREPEGMWLAETAVDTASLEALAEAGVKFTVLAPHQARRWRKIGTTEWTEIPGGIDPSRAYVAKLPSGRSIALFFYDGNISRQVAFERLLDNGERFTERLLKGFDDRRNHPQLMHIATDGESYGHHHAHGDMALAYALQRLKDQSGVKLTNYGEFLALHPPEWEVEVHENSSWSCAHGIGRWSADCGCKTRGDWHQKWREPLRKALDWLKSQLDHLFGTRGRECFPDPWAARDAYIDVVLDRSQKSVKHFLKQYGHPDLDDDQVRDALRLLEMQRDAMLMFTSCGWFFDEISGLETVQCLSYAARAIDLARLFHRDFERRFVQILKTAPSNIPAYRDGKGVWEQVVRPSTVDLDRVLAHCAMGLVYPSREGVDNPEAFEVEVLEQEVRSRGGSRMAVGRLKARSRRTWDESETAFVVIHFGGLDFHTVLRQPSSLKEYEAVKKKLLDAYQGGSLADVTAIAAREFEGKVHRLDDLFADERRRVIAIVLQDRVEDYQRTFERLSRQDDDVLHRLGRLQHPIPKSLRAAASSDLDLRLREELARLETDGGLETVRDLFSRGKVWGYKPEASQLEAVLSEALARTLRGLDPSADLSGLVARAAVLLDAAALLGISLNLWEVQNQLLDAHARLADSCALTEPLVRVFADLATKLNLNQGLLGWRP
jgi:alpha-amylase/alpha-mannosidase (GH57 family)